MKADAHIQIDKSFTRAIASVVGAQASNVLASKLLVESAFFEVTPLPDDEYQFTVKADRQGLLQGAALFPADDDKPFARASVTVLGVERSSDLASKLVAESAFFEVTPFPNGLYLFAVKVDRKSLLPFTESLPAH
jgi:hypothetical protein